MKVDVALNYYGKPYQTMLTIESLLEHSGQHIGTIFLTHEAEQPRGDTSVGEAVLSAFVRAHADHLTMFSPEYYLGYRPAGRRRLLMNAAVRLSARYQYALEASDKQYVFVAHNDVLFRADLVGDLVRAIQTGPHAGAGLIGQCWNCPAFSSGLCDGDRHVDLHLSYLQALLLTLRVRSPRTFPWRIDPRRPVPLPECRLNEFACLLDAVIYRKETVPRGSSLPFGVMDDGTDIGCSWFRSMVHKGFTFANVHIWDYCTHVAGHPDLFDPGTYGTQGGRGACPT
ncbi:MAG: hypothetical protein ACLQUT_04650 [Thermoleophilia bacterium]